MQRKSKYVKNFIQLVEKLTATQRQVVWLVADFGAHFAGLLFAIIVLFNIANIPAKVTIGYLLVGFISYVVIGKLTGVLGNINRYMYLAELTKLFFVTLTGEIIATLFVYAFFKFFSVRFTLVSMTMTVLLIESLRTLWKQIYESRSKGLLAEHSNKKKVVVFGAGDGGAYFMHAYNTNPGNIEVIGILDRDASKHNKIIAGAKVLGNRELLPMLKEQGAEEVIIAIPSLSAEEYEQIIKECNQVDLKVFKMPKVESVIQGVVNTQKDLPKVEIADLLGRKEVSLDETLLRNELEGKTILVTGAGGSIGSEIVRQVSRFNPRRILLLGHGENSIYLIYHEMLKQQKMTEYVPIIADIQDKARIKQIMTDERPDIVYHAAAHKHVPLMEMNPIEAYKNNILGTYNVATSVHEVGINKMVMISTDKAVNPPNVMGASKRVSELIITGLAQNSQSIFCAVRFGNVLGSRGSVIPVFKRQIEEGGPVTVTDFRMTRYFMTIPEASRLVIHAGAFAQSGEVFVLDMGEPVKIIDLAKKLILLSGYNENEIEIIETGIRPGEKLFEEILLDSEKGDRQIEGKIFVGNVAKRPLEETKAFIDMLGKCTVRELKEKIIRFANFK